MKIDSLQNRLLSALCIALIAASALCATGCDSTTENSTNQPATGQEQSAVVPALAATP